MDELSIMQTYFSCISHQYNVLSYISVPDIFILIWLPLYKEFIMSIILHFISTITPSEDEVTAPLKIWNI